jgi:hypothetical protein
MSMWNCGARDCNLHRLPEHRCNPGTWLCGRRGLCPVGHRSPSDCCQDTSSWHCGARSCPGKHTHPNQLCPSGPWYCGRAEPPCLGHRERWHRCEPGAAPLYASLVKRHVQPRRLDINLGHSMQAVNYVLGTVKMKGANWDKYRGEPSYERGTAPKDALDICLYDTVRPEADREIVANPSATMLDRYRIIANIARHNACGNCGENSILAFIYLYDVGVRPIDRMSVDKDHAFVVIGRQAGDASDWKTWGDAAVLCDPWAQGLQKGDKKFGTYAGTDFEVKMRQVVGAFTVKSDYREE